MPSILALFLLAIACATDSPLPRSADTSDTGSRIVLISEDEPPLVQRPAPRRAPVEVTQAEYEATMEQFARGLRDKLPPRPSKRLEVISWKSSEKCDERDNLVQDYRQWCEGRGTPGDCLNLLKGRLYLDDEAKRQWAFALTTEGVWRGAAAVLGDAPSLAKALGLGRESVDDLLHSATPPPGYTWHHHQDVGRMQLVLLSEHKLANSHTGGMAIWGGGYPR